MAKRRLRIIRAGDVRPGDVLWSSATERPLRVIARAAVPVDADGNLLDDAEPDQVGPQAVGIVLSVLGPAGDLQRLGAYSPRARLQTLR